MALTTTITAADVAVALGRETPTGVTADQWSMWITDALMLIQSRATTLEVADADIDQTKLDYVIREAVVAQVRRPDDATQVTVSVDDGSTSKTYRSGGGRVGILEDWWVLLGLTPSGGGAFDVDRISTTATHQPWCSLMLGAAYCSCGADLAGYPLWEY